MLQLLYVLQIVYPLMIYPESLGFMPQSIPQNISLKTFSLEYFTTCFTQNDLNKIFSTNLSQTLYQKGFSKCFTLKHFYRNLGF